MPKPTLADKLVVAISSRALFDLTESHRVYTDAGVDAYHRYQIEHEEQMLAAAAPANGNGSGDGQAALVGETIVGERLIHDDVLWACTTCRACEEACPVLIEYVDKIVDMRRHLV